jgi:GMP synthase (glutamine-hydrolysing)
MRVHFIVHESFEAPGAYATWARGFKTFMYDKVYTHEVKLL